MQRTVAKPCARRLHTHTSSAARIYTILAAYTTFLIQAVLYVAMNACHQYLMELSRLALTCALTCDLSVINVRVYRWLLNTAHAQVHPMQYYLHVVYIIVVAVYMCQIQLAHCLLHVVRCSSTQATTHALPTY
jgi:hypothetical protein